MTGLEQWAIEHNATPEEIKILIKNQNMDCQSILGNSLIDETPIPTGRDSALEAMLDNSRKTTTDIPITIIAEITGVGLDILTNLIRENYQGHFECPDDPYNLSKWAFGSDKLHELICDIAGGENEQPGSTETDVQPAASAPTPDDKPIDESADVKKKPAKPATRRKTKYSITKNAALEMFPQAKLSVREIRAFLLSLPEHKPQDMALMSDEEIMNIFNKDYMCASTPSGTLVMLHHGYDKLIAHMSGSEMYYIPAQNENTN